MIIILIISLILTFSIYIGPAYAEEDITAPRLISVEVLTPNVNAGDSIRVKIEVEETGTGITEAGIGLVRFAENIRDYRYKSSNVVYDSPQYSSEDEYFTIIFDIPTDQSIIGGEWMVSRITLVDAKGNDDLIGWGVPSNYIKSQRFETVYEFDRTIQVSGGQSEEVFKYPVLNSIKIQEKDLTPSDNLTIELNVTCELGLSSFDLGFIHRKDNMEFSYHAEPTTTKKGTHDHVIKVPLPSNIHNGEWELINLYINDGADGNGGYYTYYTTNEGEEGWFVNSNNYDDKFEMLTFNITGGVTDTEKPLVTDISILMDDKVVQKPGMVPFKVDILEEDSGVTSLVVEAVYYKKVNTEDDSDEIETIIYTYNAKGFGPPEGAGYPEAQSFSKPLTTGSYTFYFPVGSKAEKGEYDFYVWELIDAAGNLSQENSYEGKRLVDKFKIEDEFDYDFEIGIDNPAFLSKVKGMDEGEAGRILLNKRKDNILKKKVLDAISGKDKKLVFYLGGYQWIMDGKTINKEKTKDLDLTVKVKVTAGNADTANNDVVLLTFADNGELPGPVQFRFKSAFMKDYFGDYDALRLYYLEEGSSGSINLDEVDDPNFQVILDGSDAWCYVDLTHNSKYLVSGSKLDLRVGKTIRVKGSRYVITGKKTIALKQAKNIKSFTVPDSVKLLNDRTYKVTQINENAFTGKKITSITIGKNVKKLKKNALKGSKATKLIIKTSKLTKASVKGSLSGSKIKTIKVSVGSKTANKKIIAKYKKYFTKANAGRKVYVK